MKGSLEILIEICRGTAYLGRLGVGNVVIDRLFRSTNYLWLYIYIIKATLQNYNYVRCV